MHSSRASIWIWFRLQENELVSNFTNSIRIYSSGVTMVLEVFREAAMISVKRQWLLWSSNVFCEAAMFSAKRRGFLRSGRISVKRRGSLWIGRISAKRQGFLRSASRQKRNSKENLWNSFSFKMQGNVISPVRATSTYWETSFKAMPFISSVINGNLTVTRCFSWKWLSLSF